MRKIDLKEYEPREYPLSDSQRDSLLSEKKALDLTIEPVIGREGTYTLRPGSTVGAVEIGDLSVLIQPKIGIPQLLSLACYAMDVYQAPRQASV